MSKVYLVHEKTGMRFEVIKIDKEKMQITLKGDGPAFVEDYDTKHFKALGYRPETVDDQETEDA